MKLFTTLFLLMIASFCWVQNNNGVIDEVEEMRTKRTINIPTEDGTLLSTDVYVPVFQDSVSTDITIGGATYTVEIIPKNTQYVTYDTASITKESYELPTIFVRTPYDKNSDDTGGNLFTFLGYSYVIQDMRGRHESEGVYFPMYSDAWAKEQYHPNITIPMDVTPSTASNNAIKHHDGKDAIYYLSDSVQRYFDTDGDGIKDTFNLSNGKMGMFGASALGNSQYQGLSAIPFTNQNNPIKCLVPIVGSNEHYNSTLFHNGVYRNSLVNGWITGQILNGVDNSLNGSDGSIYNTIHSPSDYNYSDNFALSQDLIDWFVSNPLNGSPSGAYPNSLLRSDLDASMAPVDAMGIADNNGNYSRYKNLNQPMFHLTGWWDIFINGQIETFNNARKTNPGLRQQLVIGPWTHQTIGEQEVGDVTFPSNVKDILKVSLDVDLNTALTSPGFINKLYKSEILAWYRAHLGGKPYFIIPESNEWQDIGSNQARIPSEDYIIPYYQFINYIGGESDLTGVPVEINIGGNISTLSYDIAADNGGFINLDGPLNEVDTTLFENEAAVKMYVSGPTNDPINADLGNYWYKRDSFPFKGGVTDKKYYLHRDQTVDHSAPNQNEGSLSYLADPDNPVATIGGNNMIPNLPNNSGKSQGPIDLTHPDYVNLTMDRNDVLTFESSPFNDTLTVIGFPKARLRAKALTNTQNTIKTDFDLMVRVLDVYPDGREMLITEGAVNAKAREYALQIARGDTLQNIMLENIDNDSYYYFHFDLLPIGHTFGKDHSIKILVSSSNYPKYQSNPHIPNEFGEFFRWSPNSTETYNYQGNNLSAQEATVTIDFTENKPNYIQLPVVESLTAGMKHSNTASRNTLSIYPNPATDNIHVRVEETYTYGSIEIYNSTGKLIQSQSLNGKRSLVMSTEGIPPGFYIVRHTATKSSRKLILR